MVNILYLNVKIKLPKLPAYIKSTRNAQFIKARAQKPLAPPEQKCQILTMSRFGILTTSILFALITDQASKLYVVHVLDGVHNRNIPVLPPILNFRYLENRGINFGLFGSDGDAGRWILTIVSIIVIGFVLYYVRNRLGQKGIAISAGLLIGGALGNVVDRIYQGYVTDFINNSLPNWNNPFSYNLADVWIFIGIIGLIFFDSKDTKKQSR